MFFGLSGQIISYIFLFGIQFIMLDLGYTVFHRSEQKCVEIVDQKIIDSYIIIHSECNFDISHGFTKITFHKQFFANQVAQKLLEQFWDILPKLRCSASFIHSNPLFNSHQLRGPPSSILE